MRICLVLEGSYPYVNGGVSAWTHQYIAEMPEHEFVLWVIGAKAQDRDRFVYELPQNVVEVQQVFLDDALRLKGDRVVDYAFTRAQTDALQELISSGQPDWDLLFEMYQVKKINPMSFLKSEVFLRSFEESLEKHYPYIAYTDAFHSTRSRLLPVLYLMGTRVPEADCYHAICTGYGGLLATLGSHIHKKPLLLTEHGIYTREREEEIIGARWVGKAFKQHWIRFFYMLSSLIYARAGRVTALYRGAMTMQIDMGAASAKCAVIANGIRCERFRDIPRKADDGIVDIGAVVRFAPIKDIKTMVYAFYELLSRMDNVRLHILGGIDDQEYADECFALIDQLGLKEKIVAPGRTDIVKYFEKLDFTILTSLSEGQPLSILESFAAGLPVVATNVGSCSELILGVPPDEFGPAGYLAPPMQRERLADAMEKLAASRELRLKMGMAGRARVAAHYRFDAMMTKYRRLYEEVGESGRDRL